MKANPTIHLFFLFSLFSIYQILCDTITTTQFLKDGEPNITSSGGSFQMGFFSPGNSKNRYVGIWYSNISVTTVVWVANREAPLTTNSGTLKVIKPGRLVIVNDTDHIIWSTNTSRSAQNPVAKLLDSGNLVVIDDGHEIGDFLWQSFDYPTDTLLPEMKIGWNFVTGREVYLSSWKNEEDPAPGDYTYHCDPSGYLQNVLKKGSKEIYRSGPWNGLRFSGATNSRESPFYTFGVISTKTEVYFTYHLLASVITRFCLNQNGLLQRWTWGDRNQGWALYLSLPTDNCDTYKLCGGYGSCNSLDSPVCECLDKFVYKNYDGHNKPPAFTVSLGRAITTTVNLTNTDPWIEEFIWPVDKDILSLCFHSLQDSGFPVISSLELRPLPQGAYSNALGDFPNKLLRKCYRVNCGYNWSLRYPIDQYDRIWDADEDFSPFHVSSGFDIQANFNMSVLKESPPAAVLQTGRVLARWNDMTYNFPIDHQGDYHIVLYFAGILPVSPSFDVLINGDIVQSNYTVNRWEVSSLFFTMKGIEGLNITLKTVHYYPFINALEVYEILDIPLETSSTTVSALQVIQQSTGLDLDWEDDPCSPKSWEHIECEANLVTSLELFDVNLRSISPTFGDLLDLKSLDLHNTSLTGEIQNIGSLQHLKKLNLSFNQLTAFGSELEDLINLQVLDLHNNSFQGTVPDSIGELKNLHLLNLENNMLQGPLPQSLNRESLQVLSSGNLCLSFSMSLCNEFSRNPTIETPQVTVFAPTKRKRHNRLAVVLGAVGGAVFALSFVVISAFLYMRRRKTGDTYASRTAAEMKNWNSAKVFSYKEIKAATNNFKEVIGRGSFGSVYLGKLTDGKQVAVKVRFDKTQLGADSFINEVSLLSQISHSSLVSLEGFCHESKQQILVYEYLPGGSLADNLYGAMSKKLTLSWVRRLKIAVDAAKGLDYLHNGSEPRIIHRDVKSSNILLDADMNGKVSDFGLSKQVTQSDATHVSTVVKGTAGYLDPEYYSTRQLTEKSDIYSFGVVLLELICGREPLSHSGSPDSFNLVLWAKPYLQAGAFEIVDESIKGTFDAESMRKAALIASRSVERDALRRPSIAEVLAELKDAYSIQLSYLASEGLAN